jgi:hypothetical protein
VIRVKPVKEDDGTEKLRISINPELKSDEEWKQSRWVFLPFGNEENRLGTNFGVLYFMLAAHLRSCVLMPPELMNYLHRFFTYEKAELIA